MYIPPFQSDNEFTDKLSLAIDHNLPKYENLIVIGDFNHFTDNRHLDAVIQAYSLNNLINKLTCFHSSSPHNYWPYTNQREKSI